MAGEIPVDDPWAAERSIKARLMHHKVIDEVDGVSPEMFVLVAAKLGDFKRRPLTDEDMATMKEVGGKQADTRATLNRAAGVLHSEIEQGKWCSQPNFKEHLRRWEEAIAVRVPYCSMRAPTGRVATRLHFAHLTRNRQPRMSPRGVTGTGGAPSASSGIERSIRRPEAAQPTAVAATPPATPECREALRRAMPARLRGSFAYRPIPCRAETPVVPKQR